MWRHGGKGEGGRTRNSLPCGDWGGRGREGGDLAKRGTQAPHTGIQNRVGNRRYIELCGIIVPSFNWKRTAVAGESISRLSAFI